MGGFATIVGIAGAEPAEVEESLRAYAQLKHGKFSRDRKGILPYALVITPGEPGRVSVLLPAYLNDWSACEKLARFLSKALKAPTFLFHVHDGDFWLYELFAGGKQVDFFNPIPDYWGEGVSAADKKECAGNACTVAKFWPDLKPSAIARYLKFWDLDDDNPGKAYPDDQFDCGDCRQLNDFMRRLGLKSPLDENDETVGTPYRFDVP